MGPGRSDPPKLLPYAAGLNQPMPPSLTTCAALSHAALVTSNRRRDGHVSAISPSRLSGIAYPSLTR